MKLEIFDNYEGLSLRAAKEIIGAIQRKPSAVFCLATGDSPKRTYELLTNEVTQSGVDFSKAHFIGLDEWVGIPPSNPGSCHYYLDTNVFRPLGISAARIHLFDALSKDLPNECQSMDETIRRLGGIDLMLVGIGMNGHVGFNEPGVSPNLYSHVIHLDEMTQNVGQKYFNGAVVLKQGITLGLKHFLETKLVLLVANGEKKAAIIKRSLEENISENLPATFIRKHANSKVFIDSAAASKLIKAR